MTELCFQPLLAGRFLLTQEGRLHLGWSGLSHPRPILLGKEGGQHVFGCNLGAVMGSSPWCSFHSFMKE